MAKLFDFKNSINSEQIQECAQGLKCGKLVIFPTETVYGIGANALDNDAVNKIYLAKGRPSDNPLIVHVCDNNMLNMVVEKINEVEKLILDKFCPGPLTIILPKKDIVPEGVTCGLSTVGIRMPSNKIANRLIKEANVPVAAPSANISGKPSGTNVQDIYNELNSKVDYMIDGGMCDIGVESTVVKVVDGKVKILRPGKISPQDFINIGLEVELDKHIFEDVKSNEKVESPGMKHKHYAPKCHTVMVYSVNEQKMLDKILDVVMQNKGKKISIIGINEHIDFFSNINDLEYIAVGSKNNLLEISHNIFSALRKVDNQNIELCIIEGVKKEEIGIAIMNRLIRACGYNYIEI